MKFLTREELQKMPAEEIAKYQEEYLALRRFASAMVKDVSKSAIGKLENRCYGRASDYVSYESSMFVYLTNAIYRHILGEDNLNTARRYKNEALDDGKKGVTTPSVLSLPALTHLKNFYRYVENKLVEDGRLRFRGDKDIQDFLRKTRQEYAKDIHVNYAFTGRADDCSPTKSIAKPISSLDKMIEGGKIKNSGEYPVFDEYTIKSMEISEYLLSRAKVLFRNPLHIKAMEEALQAERLAVVENHAKGPNVKEFYTGTVSEVLARMKNENTKALVLASAQKRKGKAGESIGELSETQTLTSLDTALDHGGDYIAKGIKKRLVDRNSLTVPLVAPPTSTDEGAIKTSVPELKKAEPAKVEEFKPYGLGKQTDILSYDEPDDEPDTDLGLEPEAEQVEEAEERKTPKRELTSNELYALKYKAVKEGMTEEELEEEIEELRSKPLKASNAFVTRAFIEESKKYRGEQLTLFDTNGNLNMEVVGESMEDEPMEN